jgi:hypothetical protein
MLDKIKQMIAFPHIAQNYYSIKGDLAEGDRHVHHCWSDEIWQHRRPFSEITEKKRKDSLKEPYARRYQLAI